MGIRGILDKGQIQLVHPQQTQDAQIAISNLERAQRMTGNIPQELNGESGSNIRTARRGATVLGSAIDMPLQEYQEILANSMELENSRAVKIMKAYYGNKPSMFFFGTDGKIARPDYTPNDTFETDMSRVVYPMPGSDINSMVVSIGQRVGMGIMSNETARTIDPAIKDPQREADLVEVEGLRKALLTGLEQQAAQGQLDPSIIARIAMAKAQRHTTLEEAVAQIHKEEQEKQQQQAEMQAQQQAPTAEQQPGLGASPENPIMAQAAQPQGKPSIQELLAQLHNGGGMPPQGGMAPAVAQAPAPAPAGV
jgi:hypothetical protein